MKNSWYIPLICFCFVMSSLIAKAQVSDGSGWEFIGGIGLSLMGIEAQDNYLNSINWNTDNVAENRSFDFSPGLYSTIHLRYLVFFGNLTIGPYLSFSQYSTIFQSTIERPESLGWNYQKNKVKLMEYKWGVGFFLRYFEFGNQYHHFHPQLGMGIEWQYAHRKVHEQEVRYHMIKEPAKYTFRESFRYRKVSPYTENDRYWTGQASLVYSYQKGKLIPFSEIGFRFVREMLTHHWHIPENWTLFYLNLGVRWHMCIS